MKIAVLLGGLRFDSSRKIVNGIIEEAAKDHADVYVFTCDPWTYSGDNYSKGEFTIYSLPDFKNYDGIIWRSGAIHDDDKLLQRVYKKILASGVPCVSLGARFEGMLYTGMDNANGIRDMIEHLIKVHHAKRINYISGPLYSVDAVERLESYRRTIKENGMELEEGRIYEGNYHADSGEDAVAFFHYSKRPFPDAIVAANDDMALGAFYKLKELGYKVPEQVLLTGYDNSFSARHHYPRITSFERPETELGRLAYHNLKACIEGEEIEREVLPGKAIFAESCGCADKDDENLVDLRTTYIQEKIHVSTFAEIIKSSSADFIGAMTFEQLLAMIRKYIRLMNLKEFYFCLCDLKEFFGKESALELEDVITNRASYTAMMHLPLVYRDNEFSRHDKFKTEELLPAEYTRDRDGVLYTIIPIHYQKKCYGYCVLGSTRIMIDSDLFHLFIMNINNALENIRRQKMLNNAVERLNRMWVYDALTGIYNRSGFLKYAPNIIEEARNKGDELFVLFLDLDGLKTVNDEYGHDEGDYFIKAMADVLSRVRHHGELLMRYGGDEFVILGHGCTRQDAEDYVLKIQAEIDAYNSVSEHPFTLSASMGYSFIKPAENMDLETLIESADREMYKAKKEKRYEKGNFQDI